MTITLATGDFRDIPSSPSPFIKGGTILANSTVPVELVGKWYDKASSPSTPNFEVKPTTPRGSITIDGAEESSYTVTVTGNIVDVFTGSVRKGSFRYSFIYDEMVITNGTITNGTDICSGLSILSPFIKK